ALPPALGVVVAVLAAALVLSLPEPLPESVPAALVLAPAEAAAPASPAVSATPFFFLPVLKSVSYQPDPFRRKLLADTSLASVSRPHSGQSRSGGSLIFCSFS